MRSSHSNKKYVFRIHKNKRFAKKLNYFAQNCFNKQITASGVGFRVLDCLFIFLPSSITENLIKEHVAENRNNQIDFFVFH